LGLDKWIKPDEAKTKVIKKKEEGESVKKKEFKRKDKEIDKEAPKILKFNLTCSNTKCKYKKTFMKKQLTDKDKTCPKCKKEMRLK
jgi:hypothetical protein